MESIINNFEGNLSRECLKGGCSLYFNALIGV
jgi:hypothetical protein